jgi:integrase
MRWVDEGRDVMVLLPFLSAYMGHSELNSTLYYVHLLPERIRKSAGIDWSLFSSIYGERGVGIDD